MFRKKKNECPKCGKVYVLLGSLKTHLLSHNNDNLYSCADCLMTFLTESQLEEHNASHLKGDDSETEELNIKVFLDSQSKADMCRPSKEDNIGSDLKELVGIYHKLFKCPRCPITFRVETELVNHLSTHSYDNSTYSDSPPESSNVVEFAPGKTARFNNDETTSEVGRSRSKTSQTHNDRVEVKFLTEPKGAAPVFEIKHDNEIVTQESFPTDCKKSRTAVQADACPDFQTVLNSCNNLNCQGTCQSNSKLKTFVSDRTGSHCINDINLELKDERETSKALLESNSASSHSITAEHFQMFVKDTLVRGPKDLLEIYSKVELEKSISNHIDIGDDTSSESEEESDNCLMTERDAVSNLSYDMEIKTNLGFDCAGITLQTNPSKDYCTLFKCLMCSMIFLMKKEMNNHLHSHVGDISMNVEMPPLSQEITEKCEFSRTESSLINMTYTNKSLVIKVMGSVYNVQLKKVYQRFYKCFRCPMIFFTKREVKNHMVIHLHESTINEEILLEENATVRDTENVSETEEIMGTATEVHHLTAAANSLGFQCPNCRMKFWTKSEFESHSSVHIDDRTIKENISPKLDSESTDIRLQKVDKENENCGHPSDDNVLSYSCSMCKKNFNDRKKFIDHKKIHGVKKFKCEECGKRFRANSYLKKHMQVHSRPYKCMDCGKSFKTDVVLELHQAMHSDTRPYECTECGNVFKCKISLTLHSYEHLTDGPFSCEICKNYFESSPLLKLHMETHLKETAEGPKSFICSKCNKVYSDKKKYHYHIRSHCGKVPFRCNICGKSYIDKQILTQHLRIHTGERPFQCSVCEKKFAVKSSLKNHMDIHTSSSYLCHICGVSLSQRSTYYSHLKKHTGVKHHECRICEKRFFYKGSYSRHMSMHLGKKPYPCETCGQSFKQSAHLKSHSVIHTGEKPYQCRICDKRFTQKSSLTTHHLTHKEGQYSCPECSRTFTHKSNFLNHLKIKSRGQTYWCKICQKLFTRRACLIHHKKNHLQESCVIHFDGGEEIIEAFIDCSNEHEEIIVAQANAYDPCEEVVDNQANSYDPCEEIIDGQANSYEPCEEIIESQANSYDPCEEIIDSQANSYDPYEEIIDSQTNSYDPCEEIINSQAMTFDVHETPTLPFDSHETETLSFDDHETEPLNFVAHEEIIITPLDRIEGDTEAIQVHFIF